jgi:hypothetical protein
MSRSASAAPIRLSCAAIPPLFRRRHPSAHGQIVLRMAPGGESYRVFVVDERGAGGGGALLAVFGPYESRVDGSRVYEISEACPSSDTRWVWWLQTSSIDASL